MNCHRLACRKSIPRAQERNQKNRLQGCTDNIYNSIIKVKTDAYAAGYGPAFVTGQNLEQWKSPQVYTEIKANTVHTVVSLCGAALRGP